VLLNPKGGSGKSTIATNLAAYYASKGLNTALMDTDPQGSGMRWLKLRPRNLPPIAAINGFDGRWASRDPSRFARRLVPNA
jgi:chromosome partitioning protein